VRKFFHNVETIKWKESRSVIMEIKLDVVMVVCLMLVTTALDLLQFALQIVLTLMFVEMELRLLLNNVIMETKRDALIAH
jgi:hypothetical protein